MEASQALSEASGGPGPEPEHENLFAAFRATVKRRGDALAIRSEDEQVEMTWNELSDRVNRIAGGLDSINVSRGEKIAIVMGNRSEFMACDLAAVALGALPFSIYRTLPPDQIRYVIEDSGATVVIVESALLDPVTKAVEGLGQVREIVVVDGEGGTRSLADLEAANPGFDPGPIAAGIGLDDPLTLIYTSGTTGPPKGVLLTQGNLLRLLESITHGIIELPLDSGRVISWLPAAHIAERAANYYTPVTRGLEVHICPDPKRIIEFLPKVRPTWFFAVPRIWEKLKAGLEANLAGLPEEQRGPALAGLEAAISKVRLEQAGEPVPDQLAAAVAEADQALFSNLRTMLGLDQYIAVSLGAAPTPLEVLEFFHAIGIDIGELWGMSETCGVITINPPDRIKLGTVGPPVPGCDVRVAEDGELLCRSPYVMKEYLNKPEKTAEEITDGWLHTGDIGRIDEDGYVTIVDRKKELIINAAGKNMSPANIEAEIKVASPLIGSCVAIGNGRPYNVALIVLDPDFTPVWSAGQGVEGKSLTELATDELVVAEVAAAVERGNQRLSRVEQIKKFRIIPGEWLPGGEELTPTMKLKRKPIDARYSAEIEALYGEA
ncbi:MAG: AMP-dependent synthetase/ligase [Solirubrobacterales bacterium]|nr:AMP-dependent synthetase/ligase [Solirubrobacterales bacterium]